ncbi:sigma-70 family RNA polymerase sigma factor [Robertmurraya yapensis]|uniref:Sigma-70 family RNA polymerase sigma factor n=1 Tax=Bacillus yapensis TaxID=2492960 RepID=A0A3S0JNS1_9BACI|nr:sigma-70 family RNA polymerase sigma factor [Bacillus yapensis]RTR25834.1 sigma-70 family RNA polymerase sigma factor [Bacillus yapensis]TKS93500.1 sigma-70 family RNA polymerase sigma factor [Bacillus yapensis]
METQELLVRRAIRGDEDAFLQLIKMYKVDLYKTSFSYFRNEEEALEALQEVTYRAFKSIRKVKEPAYFKTWLIRIMINYCNDQLRKKKREVLNEEYLASQGISETHEGLEIEEALLGLDQRSREIITLKYFHGLKIKEIALAMECPEGTVKTWLHKALESLRLSLSEKGGK